MIHKNKEEIKEHQLPPSPNFRTIRHLTEWAAYQYLPNIYNELWTIAANDDAIILYLNHSVSDGKYVAGLARHLQEKPKNMNGFYFSITFDDEFSEEIKERLKKPLKFFENDVNYKKFRNFDEEKSGKEILYDDICFHLALLDWQLHKILYRHLTIKKRFFI